MAFFLAPLARAMGLAGKGTPGVIITGGSQFAASFAQALQGLNVPVLIAGPNRSRLRSARDAGLPVFYGDVLSEAAEHSVEIMSFGRIVAVSDNDAYNTLVATDLAPEFGRENVFQLGRLKSESKRLVLPPGIGRSEFRGQINLS